MFNYNAYPSIDKLKCPCPQCVERRTGETMWMCDSGASDHFTMNIDDFSEYTPFNKNDNRLVKTASSIEGLEGQGTDICYPQEKVISSKYFLYYICQAHLYI